MKRRRCRFFHDTSWTFKANCVFHWPCRGKIRLRSKQPRKRKRCIYHCSFMRCSFSFSSTFRFYLLLSLPPSLFCLSLIIVLLCYVLFCFLHLFTLLHCSFEKKGEVFFPCPASNISGSASCMDSS